MKIGITIHATDQAISPVDLAREAEARGFHSLYIPEHTHIPISRRTPPPTGEEELPEEYSRSPDPYIALAAAASSGPVVNTTLGPVLGVTNGSVWSWYVGG